MRTRMLLTAVALFASACSGSTHQAAPSPTPSPSPLTPRVLWPLAPEQMVLARKAGLTSERTESLTFHVHAHLDVFVDGQPIVIPAGVGINIADPAVHTFHDPPGTTQYGGINAPCVKACISPLHTHATDGVLHTESKNHTPNTLGQFFTEWGVRLTPTCVGEFCAPAKAIAFYQAGVRVTTDPRELQLGDSLEIAIVIGTPPASIPSDFPPEGQ